MTEPVTDPEPMHPDAQAEAEKRVGLVEDARDHMRKALGTALLVSAYRSVFWARFYVSVLLLLVEKDNHRAVGPEQIVRRFGRSKGAFGANQLCP